MTDNVPVSREDGPGRHAAAGGVDGAGGSAAGEVSTTLEAAFPRTHHILTLEFGDRADFDDPRREWRRLFSELLGTFALVLVAAGGGILHAKGQISLAAAVVAPGLMVMAIILFMGAVSERLETLAHVIHQPRECVSRRPGSSRGEDHVLLLRMPSPQLA